MTDKQGEAAILTLLEMRGPGKSICPSEAARHLAPDAWRGEMARVRLAAERLCQKGRVIVTQKGRRVDPHTARGPIRISLPPSD